MFSLVVGTVVWATLPQHRVATLAAGAAWTLVKGARKHLRERRKKGGAGSVVDEVCSGVTLEWQDVRMTLLDKKGRPKKHILRGVSGKASPGRLLAIMGPSGEPSAATVLLQLILQGQCVADNSERHGFALHRSSSVKAVDVQQRAH